VLSLAGENRNQAMLLDYPLDILGIAAMLHGNSVIGFKLEEVGKDFLLFLPGELAGRVAFHVFILKISFKLFPNYLNIRNMPANMIKRLKI